jgi:hypothetical protein
MADDADAIYAEIERRKRRAKELGVPQLIWGLFETIRYFPKYASDDPPGYKKFVPLFVRHMGVYCLTHGLLDKDCLTRG